MSADGSEEEAITNDTAEDYLREDYFPDWQPIRR